MTRVTYKDPEEDSDLEGILEENDVDEDEDEAGFVEPEMMIGRLNHELPRNGYMPQSHFSC